MPVIPPEMREDRGEIEAALTGNLPLLVEEEDILGDMHIHTNWSDGSNTVEEIVKRAIEKGYKFIGLADHSKTSKFAGGLTVEELRKRNKEIDEISKNIQKLQF